MMVYTGSGPHAEESFFVLCKQRREANSQTFKDVLDHMKNWYLKDADYSKLESDFFYASKNFRYLEEFLEVLAERKNTRRMSNDDKRFFERYPSVYERREFLQKITERYMRTVVYNIAAFTSIDEFKQWMSKGNGIDPRRVQVTPDEDKPFFYKINLLIGFGERGFECVGGPYEKSLDIELSQCFLMETSSQFHGKSRELYASLQVEYQAAENAQRELWKQEEQEQQRKAAEAKAKRAAKKAEAQQQ